MIFAKTVTVGAKSLFVYRLILISFPLYRSKGREVRNMEKLKDRTIDRINRIITLKMQSN